MWESYSLSSLSIKLNKLNLYVNSTIHIKPQIPRGRDSAGEASGWIKVKLVWSGGDQDVGTFDEWDETQQQLRLQLRIGQAKY